MARRTLIRRNVKAVVEAAARQADPLLPGALRPLAGADRRRLGRPRRRARSASPPTPRPRGGAARAWAPCPTALIAAYGGDTVAGRAHVRRPLRRRDSTSPSWWTSRTTRCAPRSRWPTRWARACGACGWTPPARMVDRSLWHEMGRFRPTAWCPSCWSGRCAGARRRRSPAVRIVASGGFDAETHPRVRGRQGVPVDAYGVGTSLLRGSERLHRRRGARRRRAAGEGRPRERPNPRLELVG